MSKKVIIIGSGTSGLAAAIRLKTLGFDVEIYEKNEKVGGRMNQIEDKGFKFDVGPTIVMMPQVYKEVFEFSGANPDDYLEMQLLDPMYTIHFSDQSKFDVSTDLTKLIKQIESISEEDAQGYLAYLADVYKRYLIAKKHFIEKSFRKPLDFYNPKSLYNALKLRTFDSAYTSISKFVKDERLRKALSFQTLYIGVSPFTGPSIYTIIPMIELLYGVWYIKGGMYQMAKAMEKRFLEIGGKIHFNQHVEEILIKDKKVYGIIANQKEVKTDIVLSNADFPWAMNNLLKDKKSKGKYQEKRINKMGYSSSSFLLYIGLDKKYPTNVHAIRFAKDFNKNINDLFTFNVPDDPSFYMYSPTQVDPSLAPKNKEVLYVLVPIPSMQSGTISWDLKSTESYKDKILDMISKVEGFEDIKSHIEVLKVYTPNDFKERFNLQFGATFGLKPTLFQSNYFRPQTTFKYVKNLYFAGSSNHPGAGVPIVLTSAKLAVSDILKDHGEDYDR
jgi:phytoene desaturase